MQKERDIQNKILEYLRGNPRKHISGVGGRWINFHGGDVYMPRGIPDIIGCYHGMFIAIEVKRPGEELTRIQAITLKQLEISGAVTLVANSVDDVDEMIRRLSK